MRQDAEEEAAGPSTAELSEEQLTELRQKEKEEAKERAKVAALCALRCALTCL